MWQTDYENSARAASPLTLSGGDPLAARPFTGEEAGEPLPPNFSEMLSPAELQNLDARIGLLRQQLGDMRATYVDDLDELEEAGGFMNFRVKDGPRNVEGLLKIQEKERMLATLESARAPHIEQAAPAPSPWQPPRKKKVFLS